MFKRRDPRALFLYNRHYSAYRYRDGRRRRLFVGPGEKLVLLTPLSDALFVWRKFRPMDAQRGVNAAVFRNESDIRASDLIREACALAWRRWPGERLYTYVEDGSVRSTNPGCCFLKAGWRRCGRNKDGRLTILERLPDAESGEQACGALADHRELSRPHREGAGAPVHPGAAGVDTG